MGADNMVSVMAKELQMAKAWGPNSAHNWAAKVLTSDPCSLLKVLEMINQGKLRSMTVMLKDKINFSVNETASSVQNSCQKVNKQQSKK